MMLFKSAELYRISTFARFPASGVTERSLARAGWFYTGVGDRVQCFRCNVTAEGWQAGDCPTERHRQLSPSCSFIQSLPSTANLLSSSHSAFSPLRIAPAIPVRSHQVLFIFYLFLENVICFPSAIARIYIFIYPYLWLFLVPLCCTWHQHKFFVL